MCWPPPGKCCMSSLEDTRRQIRICLYMTVWSFLWKCCKMRQELLVLRSMTRPCRGISHGWFWKASLWDQPQFLDVLRFQIQNIDKDLRRKVSARASIENCCLCSILECFSLNVIPWKLNENDWLIFIVEFWTPRGIVTSNVHSMAVWIWMRYLFVYHDAWPPTQELSPLR